MRNLLFPIIAVLILGSISACGVKGKPLPPTTPPVLGRGEPNYSGATENLKLKKKKNPKIEGDFEDENDFNEGSN